MVPAVFALAVGLSAQTPLFRLKDIRAGMHGVGRTVFSGNRIEEFQVEILGVLDNFGPKESLAIGRPTASLTSSWNYPASVITTTSSATQRMRAKTQPEGTVAF